MKSLESAIREFLVERKWDTLRPADLAKSISIEAAELLEQFQWTSQSLEEVRLDPAKIAKIEEELADVLIYCLDMSVTLGLDTEEIVMKKLEKAKKKYPVEHFKNREASKDPGSEEIYWKIKKESRENDQI